MIFFLIARAIGNSLYIYSSPILACISHSCKSIGYFTRFWYHADHMNPSEFEYTLPSELIAQKPTSPRDHCRLMVLDVAKKTITHRRFFEIGEYLNSNDILVVNDSKVIPARLFAHKATGGKVEVFLTREESPNVWHAILGNVREQDANKPLTIAPGFTAIPLEKIDETIWRVQFSLSGAELMKAIQRYGTTPTPPYIQPGSHHKEEYQNIYAHPEGSVAAPTAGLHFTEKLLTQLSEKGITRTPVTLHVGPGTFAPIRTTDLSSHRMHAEWAHISPETASLLNASQKSQRRIIAVGTTTTRTLEAFTDLKGFTSSGTHDVDLFIRPGYAFRCVDALITNFHLPQSTLLVLVCSFIQHRLSVISGKPMSECYQEAHDFLFEAYKKAVHDGYRFYSFGDAMVIF